MKKIMVNNPNGLSSVSIINRLDENVISGSKDITRTQLSIGDAEQIQRKANEIEEELIFEGIGKCYISGERDIKRCYLDFEIDDESIPKKVIKDAINYAFESLDMETICIELNEINHKLEKQLTDLGFINLGEVNNKIVFLKEKEEKEIVHMTSNKK